MALVFSPNYIISQNPRSFKSPNFKFNQRSLQFRRSSTFAADVPKRRRIRSFSSSGEEDQVQSSDVDDEEVKDVGVKAALSMLKFYKREISPLMPNSCRYVPTCSEYSMIAYKKYGVAKGTILTAWRLCRCNPLGGSGFDPPRWFGEKTTPEQ